MCTHGIICGIITLMSIVYMNSFLESSVTSMHCTSCYHQLNHKAGSEWAQNNIGRIIMRCDVCTGHPLWNHITMRCVHRTSLVEAESSFYVLSISRDAWSNSGDIVRGEQLRPFLRVFNYCRSLIRYKNREIQVCCFEHLLHIDQAPLLHFLILASVFKFLWFEESFRKTPFSWRISVVSKPKFSGVVWTGAQVEMAWFKEK